jgi:hypothetical protein
MEAAAFRFVALDHQTKERQLQQCDLARKMVHPPVDYLIT